mmetsp:Transcript_40746/g.53456  ORF Transcript_40746/g.53456 Transcript_40746/m.53456 type:complete len:123 (+) Transcript_40746:205-573(+)|eukprot:CAMPEP_0185571798 /NCGR_PEP_ID=MMETSP0434-20130131/3805_1 /TAXON_ID=626734 ORGANISM="Favella taraikaensis, Strain Fe Narragansett Bay" /NCGR_SAMPLE_ID=MMETSP0434 /ASSEMBLY_ACC=CAM_ASM_000379 /LENGTH=122 /DNA_ID=CAMNT_0028187389 /DNA_START=43 /DNA_END=411 /DNA_ORIENTATION=+
MVHGFGGGGAQFFMMVKHLRKYFTIYLIDVLGQGMSGRPDYEIKHDFDSTIAYFTESIHAWVAKSELKDQKFTLLGHSMGGMFAGWYALKYPEQVERLVFMSSVGITRTPDWANVENFKQSV